MYTLALSSGDWYASQERLDNSDAIERLRCRQLDGKVLAFGYFRSQGGVMQTGVATLLQVTRSLVTLDTQGSRLAFILKDATFLFGNLGFLAPDNRAVYDIDGLSIFLGNNDWVYLFEDSGDVDVSKLGRSFGLLP